MPDLYQRKGRQGKIEDLAHRDSAHEHHAYIEALVEIEFAFVKISDLGSYYTSPFTAQR